MACVSKRTHFAVAIDTEQLSLDIILGFIAQVSSQNTAEPIDIENAELQVLCRTISKRRTINAVRSAARFSRHLKEYACYLRDRNSDGARDKTSESILEFESWMAVKESLSPTQCRILELLLQGYTFREVASELATRFDDWTPSGETLKNR